MDHILISLYVPALEEAFDVMVPDFMPVGDVIRLLGQALAELSYGNYVISGNELLCAVDRNQLLLEDYSLSAYGVGNGDRLMIC